METETILLILVVVVLLYFMWGSSGSSGSSGMTPNNGYIPRANPYISSSSYVK